MICDIARPDIVALPNNLLADASGTDAVANHIEAMRSYAQTLAEGAQQNFGFDQGELTMLFMDMPNVPPQYTPVIVAQASQTKQQNTDRTIGICHPIENKEESRLSAVNGIDPVMEAMSFIEKIVQKKFDESAYISVFNSAKMTLLQAPKHGELRLYEQTKTGRYLSADYSYEGPDRATVLVEVGGYKVKVIYHFVLMSSVPGSGAQGDATDNKRICPKGYMWKISTTLDPNGNLIVNSVEYQSPIIDAGNTTTDTATLAATLRMNFLGSLATDSSGVTLNIADLPAGALGQTTGTSITLDNNAANHNWFIDPTPGDNSEYLPTADANIWQARAGSEAAGKMDMLSVLLHEYGHVLGIEHSADQHASMATTLTPGTRRLPSADEMALMSQLVGNLHPLPPGEGGGEGTTQANSLTLALSQGERELPNAPMAPLGGGFAALLFGRLRASRFGGVSTVFDSAQLLPTTTQYVVAANATLTNTDFAASGGAGGTGPANVAIGWHTTGNVVFNQSSVLSPLSSGSATLNETASAQTRLNQVFALGANDRFLRFTLDNIALDDVNAAPDDAFEVALLDANTGLSLFGSNGLTRTDAFLNIQANGTERLSANVSSTRNADGSRTYLVDLSSVVGAAGFTGTVANLSFDLIGFGRDAAAVTSRVSVRDLKLGIPETHDDSVIAAEDTRTVIHALDNDLDANQPGFALYAATTRLKPLPNTSKKQGNHPRR